MHMHVLTVSFISRVGAAAQGGGTNVMQQNATDSVPDQTDRVVPLCLRRWHEPTEYQKSASFRMAGALPSPPLQSPRNTCSGRQSDIVKVVYHNGEECAGQPAMQRKPHLQHRQQGIHSATVSSHFGAAQASEQSMRTFLPCIHGDRFSARVSAQLVADPGEVSASCAQVSVWPLDTADSSLGLCRPRRSPAYRATESGAFSSAEISGM
jgi:hypothetical protein